MTHNHTPAEGNLREQLATYFLSLPPLNKQSPATRREYLRRLEVPVEGDTIPYEFDGETFYFRRRVVEQNDARVRELTDAGVIITYILLNSQNWGGVQTPDELWEIIKHPGFCEGGRISAFNMKDERAVRYYMAWIAFLTDRYTLPGAPYGRAVGHIVGNEVNSGFEWCNMGEASVEQYVYDYTISLRLCWQVSTSIWAAARTYISLDHFWTGANFSADPNRFYGSKHVLEELVRLGNKEGQIGWNVAHHPYPENLCFPDFWNDTTATEDDDTFRQGLEKMRYHGYTAIPVVDKAGKYVGTLTEGDFLWHIIDIGGASMEECEELHIANILKPDRNPPVKITARVEELTEGLLTHNFLPVTDDSGAFIGIVTRQRVIGYLKEKRNK